MEFLNWELKRAGLPIIPHARAIDTLEISRKLHPGAKHTLDALCNRYGIDLSARMKHGALVDAELLALVYMELTGGRQIGLDLSADLLPEPVEIAPRVPIDRMPRPHAASEAELQAHASFVSALKSPLWQD
jgi:DNA polymerase-3 subunit epsilon